MKTIKRRASSTWTHEQKYFLTSNKKQLTFQFFPRYQSNPDKLVVMLFTHSIVLLEQEIFRRFCFFLFLFGSNNMKRKQPQTKFSHFYWTKRSALVNKIRVCRLLWTSQSHSLIRRRRRRTTAPISILTLQSQIEITILFVFFFFIYVCIFLSFICLKYKKINKMYSRQEWNWYECLLVCFFVSLLKFANILFHNLIIWSLSLSLSFYFSRISHCHFCLLIKNCRTFL